MKSAIERASSKLTQIIEREGDAGGERLTEGYFSQLVTEAEREIQAEAFYCRGENYGY